MDSLRTTAPTTVAETAIRQIVLVLTLVSCTVLGQVTPWLLIVVGVLLLGVMARRGTLLPAFESNRAAQLFAGVFVVIALCYVISARHWTDMLWAGHFATLLLFVPFLDLMSRGARRGNAERVADLAFAGTVVTFVWAALAANFFGWARAGAPLLNPILLGNTALLLGFLSLIGVLARGVRTPTYLLGPLLAVAVIAFSGSRGPLLGVLPLTVLAAVMIGRELRLRWPLVAVVALGYLAVSVLLVMALGPRSATIVDVVQHVVDRVARRGELGPNPIIGLPDASANVRLLLWQAGLSAFLDSPLIGHGWGHLMEAANRYLAPENSVYAALPHLHNDLVNFAVAAGAVGVFLYLVLLLTPTVALVASATTPHSTPAFYGLLALTIAYCSAGLTDLMFGYQYHTMLFVVLAAILVGYCRTTPAQQL